MREPAFDPTSMRPPYSPTVRRRRLSAMLKRLRKDAGLTMAQVAEATGWQASKVAKIETGERKRVTESDLKTLFACYHVDDEQTRDSLRALAKDSKDRGWWARYRDAFRGALPEFESEAASIRTYETQLVPGLLQTPEYAYAVFRGLDLLDHDTITRKVESRMQRQSILNRHRPPIFQAVIDEAALYRKVGTPEIMRDQLEHLTHMAVRHNVSIYMLPFSSGAHAATAASFTILDFPHPLDLPMVHVETLAEDLYVDAPDVLNRYNLVYSWLQGSALSLTESADLISERMTTTEW